MSSNACLGQHQCQQKGHTGCRGCGLPWLHIPPRSPPVLYRDELHKSLLLQLYNQPPDSGAKVLHQSDPPLVTCLLAAAKELKSRSRKQDECFRNAESRSIDAIPWSRLQRAAKTPSLLRREQDEDDRIDSALPDMPQPSAETIAKDAVEISPANASSQILYNTAFLGSPGDAAAERLEAAARADTRTADLHVDTWERPESPAARVVAALRPNRPRSAPQDGDSSYQAAYASIRQEMVKSSLAVHAPTLHLERRSAGRQNSLPPGIRDALLSHVHLVIAPYGDFSDREAVVSMLARSVQDLQGVACSVTFPRFEVLVLGDEAPTSACCQSPLLVFFDVARGMSISCSNGKCSQPLLYSADLTVDTRVRIWGRWIRFNGGMLPQSYGKNWQHGDLASSLLLGRLKQDDLGPLHLVPLVGSLAEVASVSATSVASTPRDFALADLSDSEDNDSTIDEIVYSCQDDYLEKPELSREPASERPVNLLPTSPRLEDSALQEQATPQATTPEDIAEGNSERNTAFTDFDESDAARKSEDSRADTDVEKVEAEEAVGDSCQEASNSREFGDIDSLAEAVRNQLTSRGARKLMHVNRRARCSIASIEGARRNRYNTAERYCSADSETSIRKRSLGSVSRRVSSDDRVPSLESVSKYLDGELSSPASPRTNRRNSPRSPLSPKATSQISSTAASPLIPAKDSAKVDSEEELPQASATKTAMLSFKELFWDVGQKSSNSVNADHQDETAVWKFDKVSSAASKATKIAKPSEPPKAAKLSEPPRSAKMINARPQLMPTSSWQSSGGNRWRVIPPPNAQVKTHGVDFFFRSALTFENPSAPLSRGAARPVTAKVARSSATTKSSHVHSSRSRNQRQS